MILGKTRRRRLERFLKDFRKKRHRDQLQQHLRWQRFRRKLSRGWGLSGLPTTLPRTPQQQKLVRFALAGSAVVLLSALVVLRPFLNHWTSDSSPSANLPKAGSLFDSLPKALAKLRSGPKVGSCEMLAFETDKPGEYRIEGYGIINASKGETPISVYLQIASGGRVKYAVAEPMKRPDIAKSLGNSLLLYSGFKMVLPPKTVSPPFTVSSFLVFDNTSFPCIYNAQVY